MLLILLGCTDPAKQTDSDQESLPTEETGGATEVVPARTLSCGGEPLAEGLPSALSHSANGRTYRIVAVPSSVREYAYMAIYYPSTADNRLYDEGAPVIVAMTPGLDRQLNSVPQMSGDMGLVEVQPIYPGFAMDGQMTPEPLDMGGADAATIAWEAVLFARGELATTDGYTLRQLVGMDLCDSEVVVLGTSGGGSIAMQVFDRYRAELSGRIAGFGNHEAPAVPQLMAQDGGAIWMDTDHAVDSDGNGSLWDDGRNPTYAVGACSVSDASCALDYSRVRWSADADLNNLFAARYNSIDMPRGVLYLDQTGNEQLDIGADGSIDVDGNGVFDEDFIILPFYNAFAAAGEPALWFSGEATAALEAVIAADAWPEGVATAAQAQEFWDTRNMMAHQNAVAAELPTGFYASVDYTVIDHGIGIGTRPHVWMAYEGLRQAGVRVRYNAADAAMRCIYDASVLSAWGGALDPDVEIAEADLDTWALPETILNEQARAASVLGVLWDLYGAFDQCPSLS